MSDLVNSESVPACGAKGRGSSVPGSSRNTSHCLFLCRGAMVPSTQFLLEEQQKIRLWRFWFSSAAEDGMGMLAALGSWNRARAGTASR